MAEKTGPLIRLFVLLQYLLPHHLLSRTVARLAHCRWKWWKNLFIDCFVRAFGVDLNEAERPDAHAYEHFNAFFTRALREDARSFDPSPTRVLAPADGSVSQYGTLDQQRLLQAKRHHYSCATLIGDGAEAKGLEGGSFVTIYLSPRDYHRVHMPCMGRLRYMRHIPGRLFSVNAGTTQLVPGLFTRNERLVCGFDTERGPMVMVLVGAMIVAGIETVWAGTVLPPIRGVQTWLYGEEIAAPQLGRGEEMGRFQLGSTVILLFPAGCLRWDENLVRGGRVQVGQGIGSYLDSGPD